MIIRIVKMTFQKGKINEFEKLFDERKKQISASPGCNHLELWQDASNPQIYFTYSHWLSEQDLNQYKNSAFFKETWSLTKSLFEEKPEAWSVLKK